MNRKQFLKRSAVLATALALPRTILSRVPPISSSKRVLVLGGTHFLGPAIVQAAIAAGHSVTLFNRGVTHPEFFPHLEKLRGYRAPVPAEQNVSALGRRQWDVVIDVWPYDPAVVESMAEYFKDLTAHYMFVSSIAAYDPSNFSKPDIDETAPMAPWDGPARIYVRGKAESERRLTRILGDKLTIVRPGPIKGNLDNTPDLWTWLFRAQSGGTHIGPGDGSEYIQTVDAQDVAGFLMLAIEQRIFGLFNVTGRAVPFRDFLEQCKSAMRSRAEFVWVGKEFLDERKLINEQNFPLWRPRPDTREVFHISCQKAFGVGWRTRAFEETAKDCVNFYRSLEPVFFDWTDPLSPETEAQVIAEWSRRSR